MAQIKKNVSVSTPVVQPYTMAELNDRIDQAEEDIRAGRTVSNEQIFEEIDSSLKGWD